MHPSDIVLQYFNELCGVASHIRSTEECKCSRFISHKVVLQAVVLDSSSVQLT